MSNEIKYLIFSFDNRMRLYHKIYLTKINNVIFVVLLLLLFFYLFLKHNKSSSEYSANNSSYFKYVLSKNKYKINSHVKINMVNFLFNLDSSLRHASFFYAFQKYNMRSKNIICVPSKNMCPISFIASKSSISPLIQSQIYPFPGQEK